MVLQLMFLQLQYLDRIIYNPPFPNQPTEVFRCQLYRKNAPRSLLARIRSFYQAPFGKDFHRSYWLVIQCCKIRFIVRKMSYKSFLLFLLVFQRNQLITNFLKKLTLQVRWSSSKYNSKIITKCHAIIITQLKKIKRFIEL